MDKLFLTILNMSLTGAFVVAAICFARLLLKKAPKVISYCLWAVAGFRLVFPFSIESVFSLIPFKAQAIPPDIAMQPVPRIDSGVTIVDNILSGSLPVPTLGASVNPLQIWTDIGAFVWLFGVVVMLIYGMVSFVLLKGKMLDAAHIEANIYEAENIKSPFVLGIFAPKIYLPIGLTTQERGYIILHEQIHIRRRDHMVKFAAYFILCLHWFNPLAWVAFLLMGVDMEMSCDERVLKETGGEAKKDYSLSLLSLATDKRTIGGSPLAFGEGGVKERIKNVLNFRKPSRVIAFVAAVLVVLLSVGFAVNRAGVGTESPRTFYLENPTEKQKFERLWSVTLYRDGTATLATPPISSYLLPKCTYSVKGDELLIHAVIQSEIEEGAYGIKNGNVIARFTIIDDEALEFKSATVPLFADQGMRYVYLPNTLPVSAYEPRKWLDYYLDEQMPWGHSLELELPEYPDTMFQWTPYEVKASDSNGEKSLFGGLPVWNVYLADLTGDGLPEFCATASFGSGIVDERIIVCDYAAGKTYDLNDRSYYDYALYLHNGRLMVKQTRYPDPTLTPLATGELAIVDGKLTAIGIDRTVTNSLDLLRSSWTPLADLPADYGKEQAAAEGVYVNVHGMEIYNEDMVDVFYENVFAGGEAFMRVMQVTTEGDSIITDYQFDGNIFTVTHDSTRDKFMAPDGRIISTATYKYLVPLNRSHPVHVPETYYLSNEQNIFTGTEDGEGAALIDELWWIPSPSDNGKSRIKGDRNVY